MDRQKTGQLIAQARHERNLTQKEPADRLHVSDRAVSKWERGAGFWDRLWTRVDQIDCVVPAYVYTMDGKRTGETQVEVAGEWRERRGEPGRYNGRFAVEAVPLTCMENANVEISRSVDEYGNQFPYRISLMTPATSISGRC